MTEMKQLQNHSVRRSSNDAMTTSDSSSPSKRKRVRDEAPSTDAGSYDDRVQRSVPKRRKFQRRNSKCPSMFYQMLTPLNLMEIQRASYAAERRCPNQGDVPVCPFQGTRLFQENTEGDDKVSTTPTKILYKEERGRDEYKGATLWSKILQTRGFSKRHDSLETVSILNEAMDLSGHSKSCNRAEHCSE